ncbi:flippase-like domain-containing protein [Kushneria phosphatilytica]|uniref:Flippase-like domain-containing protein n=2 Tax=Kushneria phosphatilytica TaxID=657387 RepID=A0A5C1A0X0_9GAMM|nr:lysylphosphatidylglycerol synthase transmembrane domain-containing protein [Kushneria phosphatilytica]QEL10719.1 flippase-like domain-containing protein [Kushneria phosphatilytica]
MNRTIWLLLAGLVAVLAIPILLGGSGLIHQLAGFPLWLFAMMLGMILVCWFINGLKLKVLLAGHAGPLGSMRAMAIMMAAEFAICATPGGTGGPLTLMALLARRGVRPARTTAVFAVDQIIDLVFFLSAMIGMMIYVITRAVDVRLGWMLMMPMMLLIGGLILILLLGRYHRSLMRVLGRMLAGLRVRPHTRRKLARRLLNFRNALAETLQMPRYRLVVAFLLGVVHWLIRYSVLYFTLIGLGKHMDWAWTFLVQMLSMAAGQITLLPGGAGGAELSSSALLAPVIGQSTAAAAILIWRAVTYYFYLVAGAPVFMMMAGRPLLRRILSARRQEESDPGN